MCVVGCWSGCECLGWLVGPTSWRIAQSLLPVGVPILVEKIQAIAVLLHKRSWDFVCLCPMCARSHEIFDDTHVVLIHHAISLPGREEASLEPQVPKPMKFRHKGEQASAGGVGPICQKRIRFQDILNMCHELQNRPLLAGMPLLSSHRESPGVRTDVKAWKQ